MLTLGRTLRTVMGACALISLSTATAVGISSVSAVDRSPNQTPTIVATGELILTTSPGILPAWDAARIELTAIPPASLTELTTSAAQRLQLPVVAKTGSANALSGGFRFTNTKTREVVNCLIPTIDTRARVLIASQSVPGKYGKQQKSFSKSARLNHGQLSTRTVSEPAFSPESNSKFLTMEAQNFSMTNCPPQCSAQV